MEEEDRSLARRFPLTYATRGDRFGPRSAADEIPILALTERYGTFNRMMRIAEEQNSFPRLPARVSS